MDIVTEQKNGVIVQPATPLAALVRESKQLQDSLVDSTDAAPELAALVRESKQLQVTSQQLIRESKELQTVLILFLHLHRNQRQQLIKQHELFMRLLLSNNDYQDKLTFLPHFRQWLRARQLTLLDIGG